MEPSSSTPIMPNFAEASVATEQPAAASGNVPNSPAPLPPLPKKRRANANGPRRTSIAWDHFIVLPDESVPTAACKHCHIRYLCDSRMHGTTNMKDHIKVCPGISNAISKDPKQTALAFTTAGEGSSMISASTRFNVKACRKSLATFVIVDEHPFRVVEGEGFKQFVRQLQPQFTIPSRRTVARDCLQVYLDEKERLKAFFKSDCSRVALTTDCWTSIQNLNYLTLTAHFIDNAWNYQKRIISFAVIPNHRGETVGRKIEEVLRDWGLRNVSTITVDNASSNDVAVSYLKKKLKNMSGLLLDGMFLHVRCCAHILNLVVNDGLKDMHQSICNIRNAVRYVRSSSHRTAKFKEFVEFSGIVCKKLLCLDVHTRWNSTYLMLSVAEKYQAVFDKLEDEETSYKEWFGVEGIPTSTDWENVRAFSSFLKIFFDATKLFSASQEVSLHTAFHQLSSVLSELNNASMNLNTILATMGSEMKKKYDKYWGKVENLNPYIYFGVIFDPRYKLRYIEWSFKDLYGESSFFAKELLISLEKNLGYMYKHYRLVYEKKNPGHSYPSPTIPVSQDAAPVVTEISSTQARAAAFMQHLQEKDSIDKMNELERYLSEPNIVDDKFQILVWWKQNASRYPILSTLVRDLMATPVSTVASESAFSTGGRVVDNYRSCLKPEMAEALICTQNWLRPSICHFKDLQLDEEYEISESTITEFEMGSSSTSVAGGGAVGSSSEPPPSGRG